MKDTAVCNLNCQKDFPVTSIDTRKHAGNYKITDYYITCPHCDMTYPCYYEYRKKIYHTLQEVEAVINAK